jgi:hypothetical protein
VSTQPIDYAALAKQAGATSSQSAGAIDYAALAKQAGAISSTYASSGPEATISARPQGVGTWLEDLKGDIEQGSGNTLPGRILQKMGAPGINKGVSEGAAQQIAGPLIGPVNTALAARDIPSRPISGTLRTLGGIIQTAGPATAFVAPEASEAVVGGVAGAANKIGKLIPSAERAGQNFQETMSAAKDVPVTLNKASEGALKLIDWQKKTQLGPTINKFLNRVTNPKLGDLTYQEARDFYQLLGRLSADEASKLPPAVRFDLTKMVIGLKQDIGTAAQAVGKGDQYYSAMKEFAKAKKLEDISDATKDLIIEALKRAAPLGFGGYAAKKIYDATK